MATTPSSRPAGSSPKDQAQYLSRLRPLLNEATHNRRDFIREIGLLMEQTRHQHAATVAQSAGKLGRSSMALFRDARLQVQGLNPPSDCTPCHGAVVSWLDKQIAACEIMVSVSHGGDLLQLREVQGVLAEGRLYARRFNEEYNRLVSGLRAAMTASHARRVDRSRSTNARRSRAAVR